MVEIAISLGVIAFALLAIIGVLPLGMGVQKENREETIINQDAPYFLDAIRSGARGLDDLTNHVEAITIVTAGITNSYLNPQFSKLPLNLPNPVNYLTSGQRIVGLLSTPKYPLNGTNGVFTNVVSAYVLALSGSAAEKFPQQDPSVQQLAFSYRFNSEITPVGIPDPDSAYGTNLQANLHEVRLYFRWPLRPNNSTGNGRQTVRTLVGGQIITTNDSGQTLYFFTPQNFVKVP